MRVLIFGASTTEGFWDTEGGWAARLRKTYDKQKIANPQLHTPWLANLGISGDTTGDILQRFENETEARLKEERQCAIIFSVGGNDAAIFGGKEKMTLNEFKSNVERLINKAKAYTKRILFVGQTNCEEDKTTPVAWAEIHVTNKRRLEYDKATRDICAKNAIPFVEVFEIFEEQKRKGMKLLRDGLHPNDEGHELIHSLVQPKLDELLR